MTAVISCPLCGGFEEEGFPEELRDAARKVVPIDDRNPWDIGIDVDQFCSQFAVVFNQTETSPLVFRLGRHRWEYVQLPQVRVEDAVADLYRQSAWLEDELEETRDIADAESLFDSSLYALTRDRLQNYDQEAWPWLNSDEEFLEHFQSARPANVAAAIADAFDVEEIRRGVSMTTGDLIVIDGHTGIDRATGKGRSNVPGGLRPDPGRRWAVPMSLKSRICHADDLGCLSNGGSDFEDVFAWR